MNGFIFHGTVGDGTNDISDDGDPSSTVPPDARIVALPQLPPHTANGFVFFALQGTTVTVLPWVFEETVGLWLKLKSAGVAVTPAAPTVITTAGIALDRGAKVFVQCSSITGVKKVGWRYT